jgi:hypothetical protein
LLINSSYTHNIPPDDHDVGLRYGLTFRTLASRWLHDEEVALRQAARDGEPWLVQEKASRTGNVPATTDCGSVVVQMGHTEPNHEAQMLRDSVVTSVLHLYHQM